MSLDLSARRKIYKTSQPIPKSTKWNREKKMKQFREMQNMGLNTGKGSIISTTLLWFGKYRFTDQNFSLDGNLGDVNQSGPRTNYEVYHHTDIEMDQTIYNNVLTMW